jgi:hypothetical protein
MTTVAIVMPEALAERIAAAASAEGVSREEFLRKAALERLANPARKSGKGLTAYELSADLCGSVDSGVTDLSSNPKYLEGFGE